MTLFTLAALALLPSLSHPAFATTTDVVGDTGTYNNNGDMLKLVSFNVTSAAVITELRFAVYNYSSTGTPTLVVYHLIGDTFQLVDQVPATGLPSTGQGWATASGVQWVLAPGQTYAIGAYVPGSWYYYYGSTVENTSFGQAQGGYRYTADTVPDSFQATLESYIYSLELDSEDPDVDNDGVIAAEWGGADCDDNNPAVGAASPEIPYDGIDQDCSGSDLTDVDGDGQDATVVGGADCNDNDTTVAAGAPEVCGDGVDQDCNGSDLACDSGGDTDPDSGVDDTGGGGPGGGNGKGGALDISPQGCGCASAPSVPGALGLGLIAGAMLIRRRR